MSDLTRYEVKVSRGCSVTLAGATGEWVKADEAEARIAERDEQIGFLRLHRVALMKEVDALRNRVRAADELADAVLKMAQRLEEGVAGWSVQPWADQVATELRAPLAAYREAGK